jgi:hypothetical protein
VWPERVPRHVRIVVTAAVLSVSSMVLASCGSGPGSVGAASVTPTTSVYRAPPIRSYLLEAANNVYFMQLIAGGVSGTFEEVLGPAVTPDHEVHDWVYRLSGSVSGHTMTFSLTSISQGAAAFPQSMTAILTAQSVTLTEPFSNGAGEVLQRSTQQLYDLAARAHVKAWTGS